MKILVSGSNGLVGRELCPFLEQSGHSVTRAVRQSTTSLEQSIGNIDGTTDWSELLSNPVDAVVHLAARVHMIQAEGSDAASLYQQVNTMGTLNFAQQCAANRVKRFIFVSTVKVLGEGRDKPYQADDPAIPIGPYSTSKWEAEQGLLDIAAQTGMEIVILRPPLVYGPGVRANFFRLIQIIDSGLPLPMGSIQNQRSLVYLGNLVEAIALCLTHPAAAGRTYLISDGQDVSTPELVQCIATALERPARLVSVPSSWIQFAGQLLGKRAAVDRLLGSLTVDSTPIRRELGWTPTYTMKTGLEATVEWYRKTRMVRSTHEACI